MSYINAPQNRSQWRSAQSLVASAVRFFWPTPEAAALSFLGAGLIVALAELALWLIGGR